MKISVEIGNMSKRRGYFEISMFKILRADWNVQY